MLYKLLQSDGDGYFHIHTEYLERKEADEMLEHYAKTFPDSDWMIESHERDDVKRDDDVMNIPKDACDGWEDIYPDREF
jgi:hypothetical protein